MTAILCYNLAHAAYERANCLETCSSVSSSNMKNGCYLLTNYHLWQNLFLDTSLLAVTQNSADFHPERYLISRCTNSKYELRTYTLRTISCIITLLMFHFLTTTQSGPFYPRARRNGHAARERHNILKIYISLIMVATITSYFVLTSDCNGGE